MSLTPAPIEPVEESFRMVLPISGLTAEFFYARLFGQHPELQSLLKRDMAAQGAKLTETLGLVVAHLDELDDIRPAIRNLAARHVAYGATPAMYEAVGDALIYTLALGLGDAFTDEVQEARESAYAAIADEMVTFAYPCASAPSEVAAG